MTEIDESIPPHLRPGWQPLPNFGPPPLSDDEARSVTPFDLLHSENYTDRATRDARLDTCMGCDRLFRLTKTCKECGCFMAAKTWVKQAACPLGKWSAVSEQADA